MIHKCECGNMVYFLDSNCPYCDRELFFEEQINLWNYKKEDAQKRLFECSESPSNA